MSPRVHLPSPYPTSKPTLVPSSPPPPPPPPPSSGTSNSPTTPSSPNSPTRPSRKRSLFSTFLPRHQKESFFPKCWPLGFEGDDGDALGESFCLDSSCSTESTELGLPSLREFTKSPTAGRFYPHIVGLQYQIRSGEKYSVLADTGWVSVLPRIESILVTIGDIAHVWSNGKFKKVRGMPVACLGEGLCRCISMSLLVTLPIDSTSRVGPLLPIPISAVDGGHDGDGNYRDDDDDEDQNLNGKSNGEKEGSLFKSFSLEDYAWRVYHERIFLKDPLDRYRFN